MKILILGGTGFVGRNLREAFEGDCQIFAPPRSEFDIYNGVQVEAYLKEYRFDTILNATDYRPNPGEAPCPEKMTTARLRGFFNLARCKEFYGKMIFFGSGAEYARELPVCSISEEDFDRVIPQDEYGFCLNTMTRFAMQRTNIVNLRLFGIFGKYELWQTRFISGAICKALHGYPITIRQDAFFDYLYIDDLVHMVKWAMNNTTAHSHYNAVSGQRYSLLELAKIIREITNADVPIFVAKDGIGKEYTASNARIKNEMGGFESLPITVSIEDLSRYYTEHIDMIDRYNLLYQ